MTTLNPDREQRGTIACRGWVIALLTTIMLPTLGLAADSYYTEPEMFGMRPSPRHETELGPIGVTGIVARIYSGVIVTVDEIQPDTPAMGKFTKGDVILGINGTMLKGKHPQVVLGRALTRAESTDGVLTFVVQPADSEKTKQVTVKIPVLGPYSDTFPLNCEKSKKIVADAARFYAGEDRLKEHTMLNALACLFLLSTGDDQYVPRVREYLANFVDADGKVTLVSDHSWYNGYNGVACGEYYLRTGDKSVLPLLQYYCDDARDRQKYGVGWGHWGMSNNPAYESGGGMQHSAGNQILLTLLLGKMCGVDVDDKTLLGSLKHWYRFVGHGLIPVSDQRYWMGHLRSAGRDGATAAVMHIAAHATGDVTLYQKAEQYMALSALTSWPARNYNWETYWHSISGQFVREFNPKLYYETMKQFQWTYDLGRQASGAFAYHRDAADFTADASGISLALAYTAPLKTLQITGAPRSKYAVDFTLPPRLWGNEADQAFLAAEHHKDFYKYGQDESIHVAWFALPHGLRFGPNDAQGLPLNMMLKYVHHARCGIRANAARALVFTGHFDEIEKLLRDPDPRLRRAALDGISACNPWFTGRAIGRNAIKPEQFTPGMIEAINAIMADPDEAWFVTDGALIALNVAPVEVIEENLPRILPWTKHDDWWLRDAAFTALMGLQRDKQKFIKVLPTLIDMMIAEYRYNPRNRMNEWLKDVLAESGLDSEVGRMIIAGFTRAALESKVLPDEGPYIRSGEGLLNVVESSLASITQAPEAAADLAQALIDAGRLKSMDTKFVMKLVKAQDGYVEDRFLGLLPALQDLPAGKRKQLADLLYHDFRPELLKRLPTTEGDMQSKLLDMLVELTQLKKPITGWQAIGSPAPADRVFRFISIEPIEPEQLSPRIGCPHRLRDITLPAGMAGWYKLGFDDSRWNAGKAPIGLGVFVSHGHGRGWTTKPDFAYENKSDWGDGEFLLARTTFNLADTDYDDIRLMILADQGYDVYLNGEKIHRYVWFAHIPHYRKIMLTDKEKNLLHKGTNTLAVYANVRFAKDRDTPDVWHRIGQIDLYLEGLKRSELTLKD